MERLAFVTGNINKGNEIKEKFNREEIPVDVIYMDFEEPEVYDIEEIAISKVKQAYDKLGRSCFVIDSGFNIFSYPNNPGYPGAFVKRSGIASDVDGLLDTLRNVSDRRCQFLDCLVFYDGNEIHSFYGRDEGRIAYEKRGVDNRETRSALWSVFIPNGYDETLNEMDEEIRKNRRNGHISAKGQFVEWYKANFGKCKMIGRKEK